MKVHTSSIMSIFCCVEGTGDHLDLHGLTHPFPTRRSSDLNRPTTTLRRDHPGAGRGVIERRGYQKNRVLGKAVHTPKQGIASIQRAQRIAFDRSEEHTSELQSLMRTSYAVFCLKKKT